ncbi:hypothetical protein [Allokutzneria albata]|uniref:Uncharacterized protein n=1 Tax=Allokutzneria albata TaxID=211114 RepID=A0A1H0C2S4_ALLAB|nr:hypothetical protein [Allokutzneria albata]SDN52191.1 hypothetical protein SAMN04489726_6992 [Allokutzneria albata]
MKSCSRPKSPANTANRDAEFDDRPWRVVRGFSVVKVAQERGMRSLVAGGPANRRRSR